MPETPREPREPREASKTTRDEEETTKWKDASAIRDARLGEQTTLTTLMLKNLPYVLRRDGLKNVLDAHGLRGQYDFIYMPIHFATGRSFGYAFVNFTSPAATRRCWDALDGYCGWSRKNACVVAWSWPHQGLEVHVKLYRNSTVLHASIPDAFKPALYDDRGNRRAFPAPQRHLRMPRLRGWPRRLDAAYQESCRHEATSQKLSDGLKL